MLLVLTMEPKVAIPSLPQLQQRVVDLVLLDRYQTITVAQEDLVAQERLAVQQALAQQAKAIMDLPVLLPTDRPVVVAVQAQQV